MAHTVGIDYNTLYDGSTEYIINQLKNVSGINFDYIVRDEYIEITYRSIDSECLMKIISGLILYGIRHLDICAGNIRVYFDKTVALIIHW